VCKIEGLSDCHAQRNDRVSRRTYGLALNLEETDVGPFWLGDYAEIMKAQRCGRRSNICPYRWEGVTRRVVNALDSRSTAKVPFIQSNLSAREDAPGSSKASGHCSGTDRILPIDAMIPLAAGNANNHWRRATGKTTVGWTRSSARLGLTVQRRGQSKGSLAALLAFTW